MTDATNPTVGGETFDAGAIAARLSKGQREVLALSCEGWELCFYFMPGFDHPGDRGSVVGRPYWAAKRGRFDDTPKAPHWRTATSLQDMGLIRDGLVTEHGKLVRAAITKATGGTQ